jgi:hypothetical protein|eukprot:1682666-Prymnesium_polylepis.1
MATSIPSRPSRPEPAQESAKRAIIVFLHYANALLARVPPRMVLVGSALVAFFLLACCVCTYAQCLRCQRKRGYRSIRSAAHERADFFADETIFQDDVDVPRSIQDSTHARSHTSAKVTLGPDEWEFGLRASDAQLVGSGTAYDESLDTCPTHTQYVNCAGRTEARITLSL